MASMKLDEYPQCTTIHQQLPGNIKKRVKSTKVEKSNPAILNI